MYFALFGFLVALGGNVDATPAGPTAIPGSEPPAVLMPVAAPVVDKTPVMAPTTTTGTPATKPTAVKKPVTKAAVTKTAPAKTAPVTKATPASATTPAPKTAPVTKTPPDTKKQ